MAAEGSVVGLVVFEAAILRGLILGWGWRQTLQGPRDAIFGSAILAGFVGMMIQTLVAISVMPMG